MGPKPSVLMAFQPACCVLVAETCWSTCTTSSLPRSLTWWEVSQSPQERDPKDCNNWRGLYVGDHAGKILSSVLAQQVLPNYVKFVGPCQFGATPKMGVTLASHTLRSFLDVTRVLGHSSAVLYLDLWKAFDLAIRETILGMPEGLPEHRYMDNLRDVGLSAESIELLSTALREKSPALQQAGVSPVVTKLLNSLHTGAWCTLDGDDHVLSTRRGGGKVVFTVPLCSTWDTPWLSPKFVRSLCHATCARGFVSVTTSHFWVSQSAKFVSISWEVQIPQWILHLGSHFCGCKPSS